MAGGKWHKESYDYFHMPLLLKPNTILAVGAEDSRPDYAYADGVTLYLSLFEDGAEAETEVTDLKGKTVLTVRAVRRGGTIRVHTEGENRNIRIRSLEEELEVIIE